MCWIQFVGPSRSIFYPPPPFFMPQGVDLSRKHLPAPNPSVLPCDLWVGKNRGQESSQEIWVWWVIEVPVFMFLVLSLLSQGLWVAAVPCWRPQLLSRGLILQPLFSTGFSDHSLPLDLQAQGWQRFMFCSRLLHCPLLVSLDLVHAFLSAPSSITLWPALFHVSK